jgi:hypothetical protein
MISRYFRNRIARMNVKTRQRRKAKIAKHAISLMNYEQKDVFNTVMLIVKLHPERILYDNKVNETLIVEDTRLISMSKNESKQCVVFISNHTGFHPQWFHESSYNYLIELVDIEAHRYRRKLKHQVKLNIRNFIHGIIEGKQSDSAQGK